MSRVDLSSGRVEEVILDKERVPGVHEIDRETVADLEVTIQSKEPLEATVHRAMEGNGIETVMRSVSKEYSLSFAVTFIASPKLGGCWSRV